MSIVSDGEAPSAWDEPHLERHAMDCTSLSEGHGKPSRLFTIWAASNLQIPAISVAVLAGAPGLFDD